MIVFSDNHVIEVLYYIVELFDTIILDIHHKTVKISIRQKTADHCADVVSCIHSIGAVRTLGCSSFGIGDDGLQC